MKVIQSSGKIQLVVACCLHGNELFGKAVFEHYEKKINHMSGLRLILANEEAINMQTRFIDEDLNRSFPGDREGNHEQRLAAELLPLVQDVQYLMDIHTTTSDIKMTPIVANLSSNIRRILNLTSSLEVAYMRAGIADHALIGQVKAGVSLEFGYKYGETERALKETGLIIEGLLGGSRQKPRSRKVFHISNTIHNDLKLPERAQNFHKIHGLGSPFLLGEKAYGAHQGFVAAKLERHQI